MSPYVGVVYLVLVLVVAIVLALRRASRDWWIGWALISFVPFGIVIVLIWQRASWHWWAALILGALFFFPFGVPIMSVISMIGLIKFIIQAWGRSNVFEGSRVHAEGAAVSPRGMLEYRDYE